MHTKRKSESEINSLKVATVHLPTPTIHPYMRHFVCGCGSSECQHASVPTTNRHIPQYIIKSQQPLYTTYTQTHIGLGAYSNRTHLLRAYIFNPMRPRLQHFDVFNASIGAYHLGVITTATGWLVVWLVSTQRPPSPCCVLFNKC